MNMPTINGGVCVVNGKPVDKVYSNGVQVYGRNLILGSSTPNIIIRPDVSPDWPNWSNTVVYWGLENNTTYTFSALATVETTNKSAEQWGIRIFQENGNHEATQINFPANTGKRQFFTFTVPNDGISYNVRIYSGGVGIGYTPSNLKVVTTISDYKLEKGTIATPWTPAPEDVEATV